MHAVLITVLYELYRFEQLVHAVLITVLYELYRFEQLVSCSA